MRKPMTRLFALILCVLLLVSQLGLTEGVAVGTDDPAATDQTSEQTPAPEVTEAPAPEVTEAPAPEVTEAPAPEVTEAPAPEVTEAPAPEVTEAPAPEATEAPAPEATEVPAPEVTEEPAPEATVEPTAEPTVEPTEEPEATEEPVADEEPEPEIATIAGIMPMSLEEAADVTLAVTTEPVSVVAGTPLTKITLTVEAGGVTFADPASDASNFSISGAGLENVNPTEATKQTEANAVDLTFIGCTPTTAGEIIVTVAAAAFETEQPEGNVTAKISVSAPEVTVTASTSETLQAGKSGGKITLTATGSVFADTLKTDNFTVTNATVTAVGTGGTNETTLTVTPTAADSITVTAKQAAFKYPPSADVEATGGLTASAAEVSVKVSTSKLQAGVSGGTIDLTIDGEGNSFADSTPSYYTLICDNDDSLSVNTVDISGGTTAKLTVKNEPTKVGNVTVTIDQKAFTYQPSGSVAATGSATITAATEPTISEATTTLVAGAEGGRITITADADFASNANADQFTLSDTGLTVKSVAPTGSTAILAIENTPAAAGPLTVKINPEAFMYQPETAVEATGAKVAAPTGTISAELKGGNLYAGTEVNGQTITVSITDATKGLKFKSDATAGDFELGGTGSADLTISGVEVKDGVATLTLGGTPNAQGTVTVTAKTSAFDPAAGAAIQATDSTITVNAAPAVTLTVKPETTTTGVALGTVTLTASSSVDVNFAEGVGQGKFTLSGDPSSDLTVSTASATGNTATLNITGKPTTAGELIITVPADAFNPVASGEVKATITVKAVEGTVTASLEGGTLTAGTVVSGQKITLTIDGNLTFKDSAGGLSSTDFQLTGEGAGGLEISSVSGSGTSVTLTLTGTPKQAGALGVTVQTSAFAVPPTDNKDRTTEGTISIGYPTITLTADPNKVIENEAMSTVTLTATGGKFKGISSGTENFSITTHATELTLTSVQATEGENTAILTITGAPKTLGELTIQVEPGAFQYQPQEAVKATITVSKPYGTISAELKGGELYAGTPVSGQTITLTIDEVNSHGLVFKTEGLTAADFTLGLGETAEDTGLTIDKVDVDGTTATLTLSGTPSKAGDITVTAKTSAFQYAPESNITATGTITINPAPTITLTVAPTTVPQGLEVGTITLTATGGTFAKTASNNNFTVDNGLNLSTVAISDDGTTATLTVSGAPTSVGFINVTANKEAFVIYPADNITKTIAVEELKGEISATLNNGTLTAGTDATGQTITLEITGGNGLTFKEGVEPGAFTLGDGNTGLSIEKVDRTDATHVILTLGGTPKAAGEFTVTALADSAFTVRPTDGNNRMSTNKISIGYPTIELSAAPTEDIYEGEEVNDNPIIVTAKGGVFDPETISNSITISGHAELALQSVALGESDNTVVLHLSGAPTTTDDLSITVTKEAFEYQPESELTVTVKVSKPSGTVTATLNGELYAGTPVNGQTVTLTIGESSHGLKFLPQEELEVEEFMLKGKAADGLTIDAVTWDSDTQVTLTLGGTPTTAGKFEVDAEDTAFTYSPGMEEAAGTFTVNPAPEIAVTADPASVTAGLELGDITITAEGGTFLSELGTDLFTITSEDGIADDIKVTAVKVEDDGTVTLTVTGAPTKDGTLLVTVDREAFAIRPESDPQAKIAVTKLTGSVSMALAGGTLTAGTAADGLTLELTASGAGLTFAKDADAGDFLLTGAGAKGLTVASVTRTDETHMTLTLKGIPATAGELGVTVLVSAFAVPPTDGKDVTAAPSVTVAYPTITLAPTPASANEGEALTTITLTATGGVFKAIDGATDGFAVSGVAGVTLVSVSAEDGGKTATLTLRGTPSGTGTLTVTVQPEAFKYQPEKAVSAAVSVVDPTGTVAAALSNALYAGTPVAGQTITVTITGSHGLSFKDGLAADSFRLTGAGAQGLSVSGVTGSGSAVTLTLSGTPAAGSFTVTVSAGAFTFDPGKDIAAGTISVDPAPKVSVSAEPKSITAGESVDTITITAVGGTFAATPDASLFALSGSAAGGLSVSAVTVNGSTAVLTITGAPAVAGTLTVTIDKAAFLPVAAASPTVEITVAPYGDGSLSTEVEADPAAPSAQFGSSDAQIASAVLSADELALLDAGAKVVITLQENDISGSVSAADVAAVESAAEGFSVGAYLDVTLIKSINDDESLVHETNSPILVVFSIPQNLRGVSGREFAVVRVHNGSGAVLQDLDSDPNTITIATDQFSTYAILYRDAPESAETPAPAETPEPAETPASTAAPTAPDTGDDAAPALWLAVLAMCAGALALSVGLVRRRKGQR